MATTIRLFHTGQKTINRPVAFELVPNKLFQLDDIEAYLSGMPYIYINNFQYVKFELEMTLKFNLNQETINPIITNRFVYLAIHNEDMEDNTWIYYYVKDYEWRSENCIAVNILCDVLNTFAGKYEFDKKTLVKREHRDRYELFVKWQLINLKTADYPVENVLYQLNANVDENATDMSFTPTDNDYIALYRVGDITTNSATKMFAIHGISIQRSGGLLQYLLVQRQSGVYPLSVVDLTGGKYFIAYHGNASQDMEDWLDNLQNINKEINTNENWLIKIDRVNEDLNPVLLRKEDNIQIKTNLESSLREWYLIYRAENSNEEAKIEVFAMLTNTTTFLTPLRQVNGIVNIDRTDPLILKIIALPYPPSTLDRETLNMSGFTFSSSSYPFNNCYKLDVGVIGTSSLRNTHIMNNTDTIFSTISNSQNEFLEDCDIEDNRFYKDTKLFHSEFFTPKFFYDNFSIPIVCENLDLYEIANMKIENTYTNDIYFYSANSITSRFAFEIKSYIQKYKDNDYSNYLVVSRNNEIPVINSNYISYIRNGYNYEVKNKNTSNLMAWLGAGASIIGTGASVAAAVATGGLAVPLAIGSGVSTAMTLTNAIAKTVTTERNMRQKIEELQMQGVSVSTCDCFELLKRYNGNYLLYNEYKPSDEVEKLIDDLFYYTGYATNRMGIPNTNNRLYFNFVQCEPVLNYKFERNMVAHTIKGFNLPKSFQDELEKIMRSGYTILHKVNDKYDINQRYENYETSVYNYYHGGN